MRLLGCVAFSLCLVVGCGKDASHDPAKNTERGAPAASKDQGTPGTPMDVATIKAVQVPGYKTTFSDVGDRSAASGAFDAEDGSSRGSVIASPCAMCMPIDEAAWTGKRDNLMSMLSTAVKEDPSTLFEIEQQTLAGHDVITTYALGWVKTERGAASAHTLTVFWNDGTDSLMLQIYGPHTTADSLDDFKAKADRAPLERAAAALVGAYLPVLAR